MQRLLIGFLAGVLWLAVQAAPEMGGTVRLQWDEAQPASMGPLALANALVPGTSAQPVGAATLTTELRASAAGVVGLAAVVTLEQRTPQGGASTGSAWVNELYATHDGGAWQWSVGKKIVAWDVGYGFRPNDVVQQEVRRSLLQSTPEGRPLAMVERYDADTAWSLVWLNPTQNSGQTGAQERALAGRYYQRAGAVDWHVFARAGQHTGTSLGTALAWVATDALELHASAHLSARRDGAALTPGVTGLQTRNPWQPAALTDVSQWLLGGTWTHTSQLSVLLEAWHDGAAVSDAQWDAWGARNRQLLALAGQGPPAVAIAGNLAWQADALKTAANLRQDNVYARLSWDIQAWQPALDVLLHPADGGRLVTASLLWKGDRLQVQGGVRVASGPIDSVLMQLPTRRAAYIAATLAF